MNARETCYQGVGVMWLASRAFNMSCTCGQSVRSIGRRCVITTQFRHNERDGVSNHRRIDCIKECIKVPRHWPLLREFTSDRWIPRRKSQFQDSRFKMALLLPIKHRIIYITVISTWNVNTSTNTAMHYHGSKGSWKSCRIYGLLVCYTYSKYISTGVQRVQQKKKRKKKVTQNDITSNYVSTTHAVHDFI